jgi:hypothetical protein
MGRVILTFDVETEPTEHSVPMPPPVVGAYAIDDGPVVLGTPEEIRALVRQADVCVGHNIAFDYGVLGIDRPPATYDTAIRGVIDGAAAGKHERASSGLADLARPLGITLAGKKTTQLSFRVGSELTQAQRDYVCADVTATRAVWKAQGGLARRPDEERQVAYSYDVFRMARRGVRLDVPRVKALVAEADANVARLRVDLNAAGLMHETGPKKARKLTVSRDRVQATLAECGVTAKPARKANDERAESDLLASDSDVLRATKDRRLITLADFKDAEKWASLVGALDVGEYARPWWKSMVASGRVAASRPNLTQVPKGGPLRSCIIPGLGNVLVIADFAALEFRAWADICVRLFGWSCAADALHAGKDPHDLLVAACSALQALPPAQARHGAKAGNYGFIGGAGAAKIAEIWGIPEELAAAVKLAWRRQWAEQRKYFEMLRAGVVDFKGEFRRYKVTTPWSGRTRVGHYTECANFLIQATGADVTKMALHKATRAGLPVVIKVHDELVLDVPAGDAEEAGRLLAQCMEEAGREVCPNVPWSQDFSIRKTWAKASH